MHFKTSPLVSVCIPTYCGVPHLASAIESVLTQSLEDFELLIIDDNSPDETAALVAGYKDSRIRYLRNSQNLGPEGNWNRCLQEARGCYFKLLPQDDLLYPDTLSRQVEILRRDTDGKIALVFGSRNIIDGCGHIITRRGYPGGYEGVISGVDLIRRCVRFGTNLIGEPGGVLLRKTLADKTGLFNGDVPYFIDLDYWVRLLMHGEGYYLTDPVSAFRVSTGSWSVAIGSGQSNHFRKFVLKLRGWSGVELSKVDIFIGKWMANLNNILRLVFYHFVLEKKR